MSRTFSCSWASAELTLRRRREFPELWHYNDAPRFTFWGRTPIAWKTVFYILAVTSTVLLVRSVYRIIEFSLG